MSNLKSLTFFII